MTVSAHGGKEAQLLAQMVAEVIKPNVITYNRFLAQLLAQMIKLNVITYSRFLILAQMIKPNVITYSRRPPCEKGQQ